MPSRWFAEPRVSSKPSMLVTHTIFSTFGKIRYLPINCFLRLFLFLSLVFDDFCKVQTFAAYDFVCDESFVLCSSHDWMGGDTRMLNHKKAW